MNDDIKNELSEQRQLLEAILTSTEKTRKYFQWTLIITVALFALPLIGLLFAIPTFLSVYSTVATF